MQATVVYLFLLVCCCLVASFPQEVIGEGHETDSRVSPDHHASNNHFSTSPTDDDELTTSSSSLDPTADDPLEFSSSPSDEDESSKVSVPPEVPMAPKADAKKDPKKKAKSVPKKKDKSEEIVEDELESTDENVVDTTIAPHVDMTTSVTTSNDSVTEGTTVISTTTTVPETSYLSLTEETTGASVQTEMSTSPETHPPTTTKHENLLSSDEQPPQTTMNGDTMESTTTTTTSPPTTETMEPQVTTDRPTTTDTSVKETTTSANVLIVTENNKDAVHHLHSDVNTDVFQMDTTTVSPEVTTLPEESKSDNNSLSNDLEDIQQTTTTTTTTTAPESDADEVTNVRKQKQLELEGGCPCNERGTSLDPSECVGGRTAADPNCPCREVCARQTGQSCSPGEPCDEEFGLHCNPQNNTCTGPLSIRIFDITHNSAKVTWGMSESELQPQALVFYTIAYRGAHTQWTKVQDTKPVVMVENLVPNKNYYLKVEEDGKQEISTFRTKDGCLFNSTLSYGIGEFFNVSCSETCICFTGGIPQCHDRCEYKSSSTAYRSCSEIPDNNDTCCIRLQCRDNIVNNMPKILVKQKSQTTLTVVWDDFRLPSYHSEYILEYKPASDSSQNWTKVQAGAQTIVTVSNLTPNTPYEIKVAVWEDDKLELPSEVITAYTSDGCVRDNRMYNVGEEFFLECDFRCFCNGNNESDCSPRCNAPYVKIGSKNDDPQCYEKVLPSDPCCVTIRCTESKALEDLEEVKNKSGECPEILEESESESKSCLSDCDHDSDCSGPLKCCPSSCGGAVCVQPLMPGDVCEHVYCGPNAECVAQKMACVCSEGFEGNPHDFLSGCLPVNSTMKSDNDTQIGRSEFELDLTPKEHNEPKKEETTPSNDDQDDKNELGSDSKNKKEVSATDTPFELDLTAHKSAEEAMNDTANAPNDEENLHLRRPQDGDSEEDKMENMGPKVIPEEMPDEMDDKNSTSDDSLLFDGCEYNNITYDKGIKFEDGCDAFCVCEGQGHVSCVPRCNVLSSGGPACKEVPDPDDSCCKIMICSFPGASPEHVDTLPIKILSALAQNGTSVRVRLGISMSHLPAMVGRDIFEVWYRESFESDNDLSQWYKKPISQKDLTEVQQGVFEFDINDLMPQTDYYIKVGRESQGSTGLNMGDFSNTVNVKTFAAAVKSVFQGCFHHNQSYNLGEVFFQGCEHKCICREKGFIECQDRCAIYIDTVGYEGCDWVTSEEDSCCSVPLCNRRKIPLMPDERPPLPGFPNNICVVNSNEVYHVGDIWESADGCRMKICRCTQFPNGTTSIQCQSECPPLPPNAHIPTARCPHPILVKPDGPCKCPYVSCEEAPPRHVVQPPRPQCEFKGERYNMGEEFHDGCIALCHCGQDLRVNCAAIECPYHFMAEFTNCLEWDIDPDFFPVPPNCCAPSKCKNDGSCLFNGRKFPNFEEIPAEFLPCGARCVCVNGNVTCENRCPPIEDVPPVNLPCPPNMAYKGHPEGDTCCLQWMCKEPMRQAYCMFQGSRYLINEKWDVHKGSQQKTCTCHMGANNHPEVECRGGCPQIPQKFLVPTEQCPRPVIVTPDDPLMCSYVVCNNTVSAGQELYNVNVVALNSTAVRIRFSLSSILVGLIGHAELHFTTDPTLPPSQWHIQKFSRPKRLFDSANIEYILNALRPNTTYFLQVKIKIDAMQGGPESELFKLKMPEEIVPTTTTTVPTTTTTTTVPPMILIDAKPEAHVIDARTVRIAWKNIDPQEKKYIYALQLKYKMQNEADDKWITTPMIHRDVTSYFLHDLEPLADYIVDMLFTPPKDMPTKIVSAKSLQFKTPGKVKEDYHLQVSVEDNKIGTDNSAFYFAGIPEPVTKHVHVIKIMYKTSDGEQSYSFKVPKTNHITLDHLKPGKKYLAQLELYLTNGQTLTSNEVEFITKPLVQEAKVSEAENTISDERHETGGKQSAELLLQSGVGASSEHQEDENRAYFIALVVVAVVAAVAGFGFVLLLVLLVRRQASAKAPISRTPSESAYDNPTYKTYDGERPEDKTNGQTIQTTQA